jgi:pimeloyl-ACP methyl ester carboxylesterase
MVVLNKQVYEIALEWPTLGHQRFPVAYWEQGQGPVLLLLHGFLGSSRCWQPLVTQLHEQFRCISLDLLGFGDSAKPKIRYDVATEVYFVHQVAQSLGLTTFSLIGHSFGGWVSAAYALQYPMHLQNLVLIAPAGIRDDEFCSRYNHYRPLLWQTPIVDWGLNLLGPLAKLGKQPINWEQLRWIRRELAAQPAARSFLLDRLRPEDAIDTVETDIHQLQIPTLVITGDRDDTIPLWHSQTYAQEIPQAQLFVLPDMGHDLLQTHPSQVAEAVSTFLTPTN